MLLATTLHSVPDPPERLGVTQAKHPSDSLQPLESNNPHAGTEQRLLRTAIPEPCARLLARTSALCSYLPRVVSLRSLSLFPLTLSLPIMSSQGLEKTFKLT